MASLNIFGDSVVETPFVVVQTAYPGEFFILCDAKHMYWTEMEEIKLAIRKRREANLENIQRYTAAEVAEFLKLSPHFGGCVSILCQ